MPCLISCSHLFSPGPKSILAIPAGVLPSNAEQVLQMYNLSSPLVKRWMCDDKGLQSASPLVHGGRSTQKDTSLSPKAMEASKRLSANFLIKFFFGASSMAKPEL